MRNNAYPAPMNVPVCLSDRLSRDRRDAIRAARERAQPDRKPYRLGNHFVLRKYARPATRATETGLHVIDVQVHLGTPCKFMRVLRPIDIERSIVERARVQPRRVVAVEPRHEESAPACIG